MANIVILSDGTGNSAAKRHKTNVWRLYEALDLHHDCQAAMYDDGVGSKDNMLSKALGGALGLGLRRNLLEMYRFLCREYSDGDHIYLFGFSRGAFTVRVLAGLITNVGLCRGWQDPQQLDQWSRERYDEFRAMFRSELKGECPPRPLQGKNRFFPRIRFIGVWDTVDAYGFPIDEVADFWHRFVYPFRFSNRNLGDDVDRACHAISVDDERKTFHPVLWNEQDEDGNYDDRITQVWFAGVHADVGGGYPRKSLALVSLDWMMTQVESPTGEWQDGLIFIDQLRELIRKQSGRNGPQHNSRAGLGVIYRYAPRNIERLCSDRKNGVDIRTAKIHHSVFERIRSHGFPYAPTQLPLDYHLVVTTRPGSEPPAADDQLRQHRDAQSGGDEEQEIGDEQAVNHAYYESQLGRFERFQAMRGAQPVILWRQLLYIFMLIILGLLVYIGFAPVPPGENGACAELPTWVAWMPWALKGILFDILDTWVDGLFCNPPLLGTLAGVLAVLKLFSIRATGAMLEIAMRAWSRLKIGAQGRDSTSEEAR